MDNNIRMMNNHEHTDLAVLMAQVWKRRWIVVLSAVVCAVLSLFYSLFFVTPMYRSITKIYIVSQSDSSRLTVQDVQLGNLLIQDYPEIIMSTAVMEQASRKTKIHEKELHAKISVNTPRNNRILTIVAVDENPARAALIANQVREAAIDRIKKITKVKDITVVEEARAEKKPFSPRKKRSLFLGFALGTLLSLGAIVLKELLDDKVRFPEDIELYLGETFIGMIPKVEMKEYGNE